MGKLLKGISYAIDVYKHSDAIGKMLIGKLLIGKLLIRENTYIENPHPRGPNPNLNPISNCKP